MLRKGDAFDIVRRQHIPIMVASAMRTIPLTGGQRESGVLVATKTEARGRRQPSDDAHMLTVPLSLVFQLAPTLFPGRQHQERVESELAPDGTFPCCGDGVRDLGFVLTEHRDQELAGEHATDGDSFYGARKAAAEYERIHPAVGR